MFGVRGAGAEIAERAETILSCKCGASGNLIDKRRGHVQPEWRPATSADSRNPCRQSGLHIRGGAPADGHSPNQGAKGTKNHGRT